MIQGLGFRQFLHVGFRPFFQLEEHLALVFGAGLRVPVIALPLAPILIVR